MNVAAMLRSIMVPAVAVMGFSTPVTAHPPQCSTALWPDTDFHAALDEQPLLRKTLRRQATQALRRQPAPVITLRSAGIADRNDPALRATRRAFRDADDAVNLALAYLIFHDHPYLLHSQQILRRWAAINEPTGHPIDETRLQGLIWAYALICDTLSPADRANIVNYFDKMHKAKSAWKFGPRTRHNNHRTHQLKMLVLLDRILALPCRDTHIDELRAHLKRNLQPDQGESVDYRQRDALFYHVYNLEAWLEIELLTRCCTRPVSAAFRFAADKILRQDIGQEFHNTTVDLDRARHQAGFATVRIDSDYDIRRFARSILVFATLAGDSAVPEPLWAIADDKGVAGKTVFYQIRRWVWHRP